MKRIYLFLVTLLLTLNATSAEPEELEHTSFALLLDVRQILLDYYHLQADETNHSVLKRLAASKQQAAISTKTFSEQLPDQFISQRNNLMEHWQSFDQLMQGNIDELINSGYPEGQLVLMMRQAGKAVEADLIELNQLIRQQYEISIPEKISALRQQRMVLLDTIELYGEYSATSTGVPIRSGRPDIASYCERFESALANLEKLQWSGETQQLLKSIRSKWRFIDRTVKRHSEGMVPFLVMRYTDIILTNLDQAQASL
jgi:hypothetical protein